MKRKLYEEVEGEETNKEAPKQETPQEDKKANYPNKVKDMLSLKYEEFVKKLKENAKDPKVQSFLNLGKKDGIPDDEVIQVDENASYACDMLFPTQSQIGLSDSLGWLAKNNPKGAAKLIKGNTSTFNENRVLTANGKYILDGHHRWSQVSLFDPKAKIPCINLVIPGLTDTELLRVIQMAIAATYKEILMKVANTETDIFNDSKMSEELIREKLPQLIGEEMMGVCKEAWGCDEAEVINKMTANAMLIKAKKPASAPERVFMPQPSDTAIELAGRSKQQATDFKGMPSEVINKIKSGDLNFKKPFGESKVIKTFESFVSSRKSK
jgi:hypothetical protein